MKKHSYYLGILTALMVTTTTLAQSEFDPTIYAEGSRLVQTVDGPPGWKLHITEIGEVRKVSVIMWQNTDSGVVVFGKVFDRKGRDLNVLAQEKYKTSRIAVSVNVPLGEGEVPANIAAGEYSPELYSVYESISKLDSKSYTGDDAENAVYVFYDFMCSHCAKTHKTLKAKTGRSVKWLPVSILHENSILFGAGVLDGKVSMDDMVNTKKVNYPEPTKQSIARVIDNTALLEALTGESVVTPTILYKLKSGEVRLIRGNPDQSEIDEISANG